MTKLSFDVERAWWFYKSGLLKIEVVGGVITLRGDLAFSVAIELESQTEVVTIGE